MNTETLSTATHKCVLIIDPSQPVGIVANIASVLSVTLGNKIANMVSHDVYDSRGERHLGITRLPIPILGALPEEIKEIRKRLLQAVGADGLVLVDFSTIAQHSKTYEEYERAMGCAGEDDLRYIGIGVCAEKKVINKSTGNLRLIR